MEFAHEKIIFPVMTLNFNIKKARYYCAAIGRQGENAAATTLELRGWDILCRNFHAGKQELDIVARNQGILHFVEVKTRRMRQGSFPATAVNLQKRHNIINAAKQYLREIGKPDVVYQYDVVEVLTSNGKIVSVDVMENAFSDKARHFAN